MCGRYASSRRQEDLVEEFEVERVATGAALPATWNVAPTDTVYAVVERRPRGERERPAPPQRQLRAVRWGLVPSWAKDASIGSRLINARVESVHEKPAFRRAFAARRCLLPADGYYEWYAPEGMADDRPGGRGGRGAGKPSKQPFFIRPADGGVLAMAGLYELWRDRDRPDDDPAAWLWTCTVLTTTAKDALGRIHDRMPLLVEPGRYAEWLDPSVDDPQRLRSLLTPAAPGRLEARPVSTEVNSVRNDGPQLVQPLPLSGDGVDDNADDEPADDVADVARDAAGGEAAAGEAAAGGHDPRLF